MPIDTSELAAMLRLVDPEGRPNINPLWQISKDLEGIKLNIKTSGYQLARQLGSGRAPANVSAPGRIGLCSKACTQADMDSPWAAYWMKRLGVPVVYHRKIWEYCYLLQMLHEQGLLRGGVRGIGFGCGEEPIPSLLAAYGCDVQMTDLALSEAQQRGWVATNEHAASLEKGFHSHLVDWDTYRRHVTHAYVDMTAISDDLRGYDFCWSLCSFEHLGSIRAGLDFVTNSLKTLRPGGLAVHTTEFNFMNDRETIDNWLTVLFQRRHFLELADTLRAAGHTVGALDFDVGRNPMDLFIDLPPYGHDLSSLSANWAEGSQHLKLLLDGFASTCFGIAIVKGSGGAP